MPPVVGRLTFIANQDGIYGDYDAARSQRLPADLESDFAEAVLRLGANGLNARARETYARDSRGWQQSRQNLRRLDPGPLIAIWKSLEIPCECRLPRRAPANHCADHDGVGQREQLLHTGHRGLTACAYPPGAPGKLRGGGP